MLVDVTLQITPRMVTDAQGNEKKALVGHLGTHFDVMDKEFPLEYTERAGVVFDVSGVADRDIEIADIDLSRVKNDMFVAFYTGFVEQEGYGGKLYFSAHPQLSVALLEALLDKGVSIIGIDFAGVRRGAEHTPMDQRCADRGVFVVENLCNLKTLVSVGEAAGEGTPLVFCTYPMNYVGVTGLPCRVVAKA